jgi:SAM-dependent methyltransferase
MTRIEDYFDAWSEFYDAELAARDPDDVGFYRERASAVDGPVLELGCGTGRITLELLADGVDAYGIDVSAEMLATLRETA